MTLRPRQRPSLVVKVLSDVRLAIVPHRVTPINGVFVLPGAISKDCATHYSSLRKR
jgi:hypothetical protein